MRKHASAAFVPILLMFGIFVSTETNIIAQQRSMTPVSSVDLKRYSGQWFEISRLPNKMQKRCVGNTTATFNTMREDGKLEILNRCLQKNGKIEQVRGEAKVIEENTNAKMKVSLPKYSGEAYWIVDLDPNYQYSVVSNPSGEYLWIFSRTPQITDVVYQQILRRIETMGFQPNKLVKTPQDVKALNGAVVANQ